MIVVPHGWFYSEVVLSSHGFIFSPTGKTHNPSSSPTRVPQEVWFHEDCVTWCHGVYLAASKVHGLDEAIAVAKQTVRAAPAHNTLPVWYFLEAPTLQFAFWKI